MPELNFGDTKYGEPMGEIDEPTLTKEATPEEEEEETPAGEEQEAGKPGLEPDDDSGDEPADDDSGEEESEESEGISYEVLLEAAQAGIPPEVIQRWGSDDAVRAGIDLMKRAGGVKKGSEEDRGDSNQETPELPPEWDYELPAELMSDDYDEGIKGAFTGINEAMKKHDAALREILKKSQANQSTGSEEDNQMNMAFDMTINALLSDDTYKQFADDLGNGFWFELPDEQHGARSKVVVTAEQLIARQQAAGKTPRLADVVKQAVGIVYPDRINKQKITQTLKAVKGRKKIGKPSGKSKSNENLPPKSQAAEDIRAWQKEHASD